MVRMMENGEVVKMSKRTGNAITIKDLIDDIGVDATRYFFAAKAANTPYDFDLTLAKSKQMTILFIMHNMLMQECVRF